MASSGEVDTDGETLSLTDIAEELGKDASTVRRWVLDGRLPAHKRGPKLWRVKREDLDQFLARGLPARGRRRWSVSDDLAVDQTEQPKGRRMADNVDLEGGG